MKNCIECTHKITFYERFKSIINPKGYLKCSKCGSIYKPTLNVYRNLYTFLVFFIGFIINSNINLKNHILRFALYMIIVFPILILFDILPNKWNEYTKIN